MIQPTPTTPDEVADFLDTEPSENSAAYAFFARFGTNPDRVSCTCCGEDYSATSDESLAALTAYERNLTSITPEWAANWNSLSRGQRIEANQVDRYLEPDEALPEGFVPSDFQGYKRAAPITLDAFLATEWVIRAEDITDAERATVVPDAGYVWVGQ